MVILNQRAFEYAQQLVSEGRVVSDQRDDWSEHRPSAQKENEFLREHGFEEYALWYMGIGEEKSRDTKGAYEFPYGDFLDVHRCGLLSAESRAGQYKHPEIEKAVVQLLGMIDARQGKAAHRHG